MEASGTTLVWVRLLFYCIQADGGCVVDDVKVSPSGLLSAHDISHLRKDIGRIPVVTFDHPEGLYEVEPGLYATTLASGPAHFGAAGSKSRGHLMSGALESGVSACDQLRPGSSEPLCGGAKNSMGPRAVLGSITPPF
ncbi:MAG: hypothetical protein SF187_22390 [Deltaproteobacteria bacterium]|nr:hypothetical protein [Deltaproteobacteria bacterium]